jgi:hypothetical protein
MKTALTALASAIAALGIAGSVGAAPGKPFTIASTLDGKTVLPHRIHWLGLPTLPPSQIKRVEFLIDGNVVWIEHHKPYVYGDDHGSHHGYLVTSWLSPGVHRFAVRAVSTSDATALDTVSARVLPPPVVPSRLAGTWERTIPDTSAAPKAGSPGNPSETLTPAGRYTITFDPRWIQDVFPCDSSPCRYNDKSGGGGEFVSDWTPGTKTFEVRGPVTFRLPVGNYRLGGWWCWMDGPTATYTWSMNEDALTLAPVGGHDACRIRGFIWSGRWTRVP